MMALLAWLRLMRPLNVLLIAATPVALWSSLVRPLLGQPLLDLRQVTLLGLAIALVAAGGNVVNDIADRTIDQLNGRPNPLLGGLVSVRQAWITYGLLNLLAGLLAWQLAAELGRWPYLLLYPAAVCALAGYAFALKCLPWVGNLTVALFCAGVPGILLVAEPLILEEIASPLSQSLVAYTAFAFFGNYARELVKDLQDRQGDAAAGCRPLAVVWPEARTVTLIGGALLALLASVAYIVGVWYLSDDLIATVVWLVLWGILAALFFRLSRTQTVDQYARLSQSLKLAMALGLFGLLLIGVRAST